MTTDSPAASPSRSSSRRRWILAARLLGFGVVLLSLRWIVLRLGADWEELAAFRPSATFLWLLVLAAPFWAGAGLLQGLAWHRLLRVLGGEGAADLGRDLRLHARLQVARYLPGHAFQVGRHALTRSEGSGADADSEGGARAHVPHTALGAAATCEAVGQIVAGGALALLLFGLAFGGGALGLGHAAPAWLLRWAPWIGLAAVVAVPWVVSRLAGSRWLPGVVPHRPHRLLPSLGLYALQFLAGGLIFGLLLVALDDVPVRDPKTVLAGLAAYPFAWVVGFLTPATPAGAGAVEAVLVATLGARYGAVPVLAAAVGFRIATLAGDVLLAAGAWLLRRGDQPTVRPRTLDAPAP